MSGAEEWRPIVGFEDYEVSDQGRVRSLPRWRPHNRYPDKQMFWKGRVLKPGMTPLGYLFVVLTGQLARRVHRLEAEAFLGPPPFPDAVVRHLNDIPLDNRLPNLAWGTRVENMADAALNRHIPRGRQRPNAKLHPADIPAIRASDSSLKEIAARYGVSVGTIRDVRVGRSWSHI